MAQPVQVDVTEFSASSELVELAEHVAWLQRCPDLRGEDQSFLFGAGLVDRWTGNGFLADAVAWLVGLAVAVLFGLLAYTYHEVCVVLGTAAVGFVLGVSLMVALNARWSWAVVLVGMLAGIALAVLAVVGRLSMLLLVFLTGPAGAATIVAGIMLLTGSLAADDLDSPAVADIRDSAGWWVLTGVLAAAGVVLQFARPQRRAAAQCARAVGHGRRRELYHPERAAR